MSSSTAVTRRLASCRLRVLVGVLLAVPAICAPVASATVSFSPAGALATARASHTATLLSNGKALVAGGFDSSGVLVGGAELYDPATNMWGSAGALATARYAHTATLLASGKSGKVLVAGGIGSSGSNLAGAELYDPATNTWGPAGALATARQAHTATLLTGGKVLVAGGNDSSAGYLASAERFPADTTRRTVAADFGDQTTGRRSPVVLVPVTNTGDAPLFVTSATLAGGNATDFTLDAADCTSRLVEPSGSCFLAVQFRPAADGVRTATVQIADNAGTTVGPQLSGTGVPATAGPTGPAGPQGPAGTTGLAGPQGPSGPSGGQGPAGPKGADGRVTVKCKVKKAKNARKVKVTCKVNNATATRARLTRHGRTYARGSARHLLATRKLLRGRYTLQIGRTLKLKVRLR